MSAGAAARRRTRARATPAAHGTHATQAAFDFGGAEARPIAAPVAAAVSAPSDAGGPAGAPADAGASAVFDLAGRDLAACAALGAEAAAHDAAGRVVIVDLGALPNAAAAAAYEAFHAGRTAGRPRAA